MVAQRWYRVDPLADQFAAWSPYNYVLGNPISLVDPDGRMPQGCCGREPNAADGILPSIFVGIRQLSHYAYRNTAITFGGDPKDYPYISYDKSWNGERYELTAYTHKEEPGVLQRMLNTTATGASLAMSLPGGGSGAYLGAQAPVWWPFAKQLASKNELLAGGGNCKQCAEQIKENIGGVIVQLEHRFFPGRAGIGDVFDQSGKNIVSGNTWKDHFTVFKDGKFFDGLTGPDGLIPSEYKKLFSDWDILKKTNLE